MKKLLPLFLLLFSINGHCEWTSVGGTDFGTSYIDYSTIKRNGNVVRLWEMTSFKSLQNVDGIKYLSSKDLVEFDCNEEKFRYLSLSVFSLRMGEGNVVSSVNSIGPWDYLIPDSQGRVVFNLVCKR